MGDEVGFAVDMDDDVVGGLGGEEGELGEEVGREGLRLGARFSDCGWRGGFRG